VAGVALPVVSSAWLYGVAALLLGLAALACGREARLLHAAPKQEPVSRT